jgi:hypothetical protein
MTSTSIQHAIAQAQAAADALTPGQGQIVPFGRPISLMDNLVGSFAVNTWLKVKPYGMTIGKDTTTLFDKLPFRIDLSTVVYCRRLRYGKAVANLALRLGLGQVLTNKVFSLFIGDEIDASLDGSRAQQTSSRGRLLHKSGCRWDVEVTIKLTGPNIGH